MSRTFDAKAKQKGTKFKVFPQPRYIAGFEKPETIYVSVENGKVEDGPSDDRMFVVDAINKRPFLENEIPPYRGQFNPPVKPGPDGHFDHLDIDSREFSCALMYATVRRTLDIWESYFGTPIRWHFDPTFKRLLLIPLIYWNNAQSGFGFLEFGYGSTPMDEVDMNRPYCQNFDVLAHELGHSIIFATVGFPSSELTATSHYGGFHESSGDVTAILAVLHSPMFVNNLLKRTSGNLFTPNELARLGELSGSREIRRAFNYERMSTVSTEPHDMSLPLTGAIFDMMVEIYQEKLYAGNLISKDLAQKSQHSNDHPGSSAEDKWIQAEFNKAYKNHEQDFADVLMDARDAVGYMLARCWSNLSADNLTYFDIVKGLLEANKELKYDFEDIIRGSFAWREITAPSSHMLAMNHCHYVHTLDERYASFVQDQNRDVEEAIRATALSSRSRYSRLKTK